MQRKWSTIISSSARRSAPGGTGWRYEHFSLWNEQTDASIPWILEAISQHRVPPEVRRLLSTVRMMAFLKPDPEGAEQPSLAFGIRPIGVPCAFRRTTCRAGLRAEFRNVA